MVLSNDSFINLQPIISFLCFMCSKFLESPFFEIIQVGTHERCGLWSVTLIDHALNNCRVCTTVLSALLQLQVFAAKFDQRLPPMELPNRSESDVEGKGGDTR